MPHARPSSHGPARPPLRACPSVPCARAAFIGTGVARPPNPLPVLHPGFSRTRGGAALLHSATETLPLRLCYPSRVRFDGPLKCHITIKRIARNVRVSLGCGRAAAPQRETGPRGGHRYTLWPFWSFKTPRHAGESLLAFCNDENEEIRDGEPTHLLVSNEVPFRPLPVPLQ